MRVREDREKEREKENKRAGERTRGREKVNSRRKRKRDFCLDVAEFFVPRFFFKFFRFFFLLQKKPVREHPGQHDGRLRRDGVPDALQDHELCYASFFSC